MLEQKGGNALKKKKIRIKYTCSDYCHHEHKYKFTAWICGRIQKYSFATIDYLKRLTKYLDDIFFLLGVIFLSLGGFLIYPPVGFFILGICCMAYAFIFAKSAAGKRGGG